MRGAPGVVLDDALTRYPDIIAIVITGFGTVREVAFRFSIDDTPYLNGAALHPYAMVAFELLTQDGTGQADGGENAGKYLELGVAPSHTGAKATVAVPLKLGLSLGDYYELRNSRGAVVENPRFGFASVAGMDVARVSSTTGCRSRRRAASRTRSGSGFVSLPLTTRSPSRTRLTASPSRLPSSCIEACSAVSKS